MSEIEGAYQTIDPDSAPKPYTVRQIATIFTVITISAVGVFCALYFTIGGFTNSGDYGYIDPYALPVGCASLSSSMVELNCAYYRPTRSWLCLDPEEPSLEMDMNFISEIGKYETILRAQETKISRETLVCSGTQHTWLCFFLATIEKIGADITSTFNPSGLLCERTIHEDWVCWQSQQNVTFSDIGLLADTLTLDSPAPFAVGCVMNYDHTWQCGELVNCMFHNDLGWSCWSGNATTSSYSSVPWFASKYNMLLDARIEGHKAQNITTQVCYYHPKQDRFHCSDADNPNSVSAAANYNHTLQSSYQCAYDDRDNWLCLRDEVEKAPFSIKSFQSCVAQVAGNGSTTDSARRQLAATSREFLPGLLEDQADEILGIPRALRATPSESAAGKEKGEKKGGVPEMPSTSGRMQLPDGTTVQCVGLANQWACSYKG